MKTWSELIREWMTGGPNRTAATLSRGTGVPRNTICLILANEDREPRIEVAARLARVLPREQVRLSLIQNRPELETILQATSA